MILGALPQGWRGWMKVEVGSAVRAGTSGTAWVARTATAGSADLCPLT